MKVELNDLRRFAVARSLASPTNLEAAIERVSFVQADPIRAPARAQDLTLRLRVQDYRAGDLARCYEELGIEEDFFVVYGFVTRSLQALMHPRSEVGEPAEGLVKWPAAQRKKARLLLEFIQERGAVHPRDVDAHFAHGKVKNYWGGTSNATTHLMGKMHYRGLLRVVRREAGIRIYAVHQQRPAPDTEAECQARLDALVDAALGIYAPLPGSCLADLVRRLKYAAPQWQPDLKKALMRAKARLASARVDGVDWYWPAGEDLAGVAAPEGVRLLTPFDPMVWDRDRFELLWGWVYRFEAYTPAHKRKMGYYAMPILWRDRVIGWGNLVMENGELRSDFGYVGSGPPRDRAFKRELEAELERLRRFLR
ncbi:MAG TPA: crosslink repair DNA glycosylase YcaQ family protein [Bryobacteraceae bacterium]|nr:crosslink repair DNA glycosylase YcaQ family protein [Bryobacteraceae bacterium]